MVGKGKECMMHSTAMGAMGRCYQVVAACGNVCVRVWLLPVCLLDYPRLCVHALASPSTALAAVHAVCLLPPADTTNTGSTPSLAPGCPCWMCSAQKLLFLETLAA